MAVERFGRTVDSTATLVGFAVSSGEGAGTAVGVHSPRVAAGSANPAASRHRLIGMAAGRLPGAVDLEGLRW